MNSLHPAVQYAVMAVLATVYESGLVDKVDMKDILRLFGGEVTPSTDESSIISFQDEGWVRAYIEFRRKCQEDFENSEPSEEDLTEIAENEIDPDDLKPGRKLH